MLVTCRLMFCRAALLLTLKVATDSKLLIPCKELRPVLVMRMLFASLIPLPPNDICCKAGNAVKFKAVTDESLGKEISERTVSPPNSKPPKDFRSPNDKLDSVMASRTVKFPVIFSTPDTDSVVCPF